jgi:hypothetical protein
MFYNVSRYLALREHSTNLINKTLYKMEKLTKEQEERIEKFWNKHVVSELISSNIPQHIIKHTLFSILSLEHEKDFLEKSKEIGVLKKCFITSACTKRCPYRT